MKVMLRYEKKLFEKTRGNRQEEVRAFVKGDTDESHQQKIKDESISFALQILKISNQIEQKGRSTAKFKEANKKDTSLLFIPNSASNFKLAASDVVKGREVYLNNYISIILLLYTQLNLHNIYSLLQPNMMIQFYSNKFMPNSFYFYRHNWLDHCSLRVNISTWSSTTKAVKNQPNQMELSVQFLCPRTVNIQKRKIVTSPFHFTDKRSDFDFIFERSLGKLIKKHSSEKPELLPSLTEEFNVSFNPDNNGDWHWSFAYNAEDNRCLIEIWINYRRFRELMEF